MISVIIIGTGIAAYTLAREFRKLDSDTPLILITEDDGQSYPKPMLSNALAKAKTADQIAMFDVDSMATKLAAEILTETVVNKIEPESQVITLLSGRTIEYGKLVLAVGASPIRLSMQGDANGEVLSINDLRDYQVFRNKLTNASRVAIIGPGLIACEFANDLASAGISVSIIGPNKLPMDNLLPSPIAEELKTKLEEIGVEWHLQTSTTAINNDNGAYKLTLSNDTFLDADIVISAVGLQSNIALAKTANLVTNKGIVTDKFMQTSEKNIYALGDCAEVMGHNLLFIAPIMAAAKALAKTLTGDVTEVQYPAMPVAVKTPAYPLVLAFPQADSTGKWHFDTAESGFGMKGLFLDDFNKLQGFVLSGDWLSEKQHLTKQLPNLLD